MARQTIRVNKQISVDIEFPEETDIATFEGNAEIVRSISRTISKIKGDPFISRSNGKRMNNKTREDILSMIKKGMDASIISTKTGFSKNTIYKMMNRRT